MRSCTQTHTYLLLGSALGRLGAGPGLGGSGGLALLGASRLEAGLGITGQDATAVVKLMQSNGLPLVLGVVGHWVVVLGEALL